MNGLAQLRRRLRDAFVMKVTFQRQTSITPAMSTQLTQRPQWEIDKTLGRLIGEEVRVAAKSFSPGPRHGRAAAPLLPVRELFLPDNSRPDGLPVFFEGRLQHFERQVGVVCVRLEAPTAATRTPDGPVFFRGQTAVLLRGPALVELAFPFQVERLPADSDNYWRDLRVPCVQFELVFTDRPTPQARAAIADGASEMAIMSDGYARAVD